MYKRFTRRELSNSLSTTTTGRHQLLTFAHHINLLNKSIASHNHRELSIDGAGNVGSSEAGGHQGVLGVPQDAGHGAALDGSP